MPTSVTVRDLDDDVAAAIDFAARAQKGSREAFLRADLQRRFGPTENTTLGITRRFRETIQDVVALADNYRLRPELNVAAIARLLGHDDTAKLDSELRGDTAVPFEDGDKLCGLVGLNRRWLESGKLTPYATSPKFHDAGALWHELYKNGARRFRSLAFIMSNDEHGTALVYGQSGDYRYDLLIQEIPIHDDVGGSGTASLREFCLLLASIGTMANASPPLARTIEGVFLAGRILDETEFRRLQYGHVHPASIIGAPSSSSLWYDDLFDLERKGPAYSPNYERARMLWTSSIAAEGVTTNPHLVDHIRKRFKMWDPADFELARKLRDADPARDARNERYYDDVVAKARNANADDERSKLRALFWERKTPVPQWLEQ